MTRAKSKSTSDTCSKCGKRIDKCVPPCPVAIGLLADATKSKLSSTLRKHLEWAWNYAIAEGYREYTTKEIARDIADGVVRGEDAEDEALLEDFARNYCEDDSGKNLIDGEWKPELESDQVELEKLLVPICNQLREEGEF